MMYDHRWHTCRHAGAVAALALTLAGLVGCAAGPASRPQAAALRSMPPRRRPCPSTRASRSPAKSDARDYGALDGGAGRSSPVLTPPSERRRGWSTTIARPSVSALTEWVVFGGTMATDPGPAVRV